MTSNQIGANGTELNHTGHSGTYKELTNRTHSTLADLAGSTYLLCNLWVSGVGQIVAELGIRKWPVQAGLLVGFR